MVDHKEWDDHPQPMYDPVRADVRIAIHEDFPDEEEDRETVEMIREWYDE